MRTGDLPKGDEWVDLKKFGPAVKELETLTPLLTGKIGLIFTNEPVFELKPRIEANKVAAAARTGTIAPIDVVIPPGPTNMDPSQISFFHALQISTKINKGQIEITKDVKVCVKGKKNWKFRSRIVSKNEFETFLIRGRSIWLL